NHHQLLPPDVHCGACKLNVLGQYASQCLTRTLSRFRLLSGQKEHGLIGFAVAREPVFSRGYIVSVISRVVAWRQGVEHRVAVMELRAGSHAVVADGTHLSEKRRLLPEIDSLSPRQEQIDAVRVTGTIVAGEAIQRHPQEDTAEIRCHFVDPVEAVEAFQMI